MIGIMAEAGSRLLDLDLVSGDEGLRAAGV
jgi:hypothetical protein